MKCLISVPVSKIRHYDGHKCLKKRTVIVLFADVASVSSKDSFFRFQDPQIGLEFSSFTIQSNRTTHFDRNYFLSDSECPQTEDPHLNFGSPKQTIVIGLFYSFANWFGATKIPMGVLRLGTLRIREKIISIEMGSPVTLYIRKMVWIFVQK